MRNIFIIAVILVSIGYMFSIMINKYETIKETSSKIKQTKQEQSR